MGKLPVRNRATHANLTIPPTSAMAEMSLRWEWRSFDQQSKLWQAAMRNAVRVGPVLLSTETYLLTQQSPNLVKLRDGRLEMKELIRTDEGGLELWQQAIKQDFPLAPSGFADVCAAWHLPVIEVTESITTPEHLLSVITRGVSEVRIVSIRKWRRRIRLHECDGERVTVLVNGMLLECLALENSDLAILQAALAELHLEGQRNTSYGRAIKHAIGWPGK